MRERSEQILKIICLVLGLLLIVQLVKVVKHANPLAGVAVPDLPSLPAETNADTKIANKNPVKTNTNAIAAAATSKTNTPSNAAITNNPTTNTAAIATTDSKGANQKVAAGTNSTVASADTNTTSHATPTNALATTSNDTNAAHPNLQTGAIAFGSQSTDVSGTNSASRKKPSRKGGSAVPGMMAGPMGTKASSLPPDVQARVDRVTDSEILGPVMHPMPMALLGIAGNSAFLRSPSGQSGLVKEGEDLGEIKLLRIGTNRVLIEENGEKKELMIFAGFGGESLLPKTESSNETTNRK